MDLKYLDEDEWSSATSWNRETKMMAEVVAQLMSLRKEMAAVVEELEALRKSR